MLFYCSPEGRIWARHEQSSPAPHEYGNLVAVVSGYASILFHSAYCSDVELVREIVTYYGESGDCARVIKQLYPQIDRADISTYDDQWFRTLTTLVVYATPGERLTDITKRLQTSGYPVDNYWILKNGSWTWYEADIDYLQGIESAELILAVVGL